MSNRANVTRLAVLFRDFSRTPQPDVEMVQDSAFGHEPFLGMARWLAARGVLVSAALTDEQAQHVAGLNEFGVRLEERYGEAFPDMGTAELCRRELERIARGD